MKCGQGQKALILTNAKGMCVARLSFVGVLSSCASIVACEKGRCIHEQSIESGWDSDVFWGSSLVDMHANCGSMEDAWRVFNKMPSQNVITWNALLGGCAMHGHGKENLKHLNRCVGKVYSWVMSLLFVFCQLVAMQVWWMEACVVMLQ